MDRNCEALSMKIAECIAEAYREHRWALFVPQQFVVAGLGSENDVLDALSVLEGQGRVRPEALVECPNGHVIWAGPPTVAQQHLGTPCVAVDCDASDFGDEPAVALRFHVTECWREQLDAEKKTPKLEPRL